MVNSRESGNPGFVPSKPAGCPAGVYPEPAEGGHDGPSLRVKAMNVELSLTTPSLVS
jgi:hypothetical protein